MPDGITAQSPFAGLLVPGTQFTAAGTAGIAIQERRNVVQLQLIARKGKSAVLANKLAGLLGQRQTIAPLAGAANDGLFVCATGPLEYWAFAERRTPASVVRSLEKTIETEASLFDQSAGRCTLRLSGDKALHVLAKGTSLDLHPQSLPIRGAAHTVIEHIPALVARRNDLAWHDISVPCSYALSLATWLLEAARDVGYTIEDPAS